MLKGKIGLSRNRLQAETIIEDVLENNVKYLEKLDDFNSIGVNSIRNGGVAIFALAAVSVAGGLTALVL